MFACREEVEKDMNFLGLLVMKNQVKPESAEVIRILKLAQLRPVMVTGMSKNNKCNIKTLIVYVYNNDFLYDCLA